MFAWNSTTRGGWAGGVVAVLALVVASGGVAHAQGGPAAASPKECATECHKDIVSHRVMHGVATKDCGSCHVQGNKEQHKFYLIAPKDELCLRCHAVPNAGTRHKPVGEGKCMECHDPHGSDQRRMLRADPKRELCTRCHERELSKFKYVHVPVASGACILCHQPHSSENPKLLVKPVQELCQQCHAEVQTPADQSRKVHGALQQGCTRCHNPHASNHPHQLHEEAPELCASCHKDRIEQFQAGAKVVHGAITQPGGCSACHEPHSSTLPALQRTTQPALCLKCHDRKVPDNAGQPLADMASLLAQNPDHHGPIREGQCTACHAPHAGKSFRLLAEEYPAKFYAPFKLDNFKLCFQCHIPDLVLKPGGTGLTQFRDGDRNLHYVHVNREKGRTCRACHEVHASKRPAHIREAVPYGSGNWMLEINFEQTPQGGSCTPACHVMRSYTRTLPTLGTKPQGAKP